MKRLSFYHGHHTCSTDDVDRTECADDGVTTRADVPVVVVLGGYCRGDTGKGSAAGEIRGGTFVAVKLNVLNVIIQYPLNQLIRGGCTVPSTLLRSADSQSVSKCTVFEQSIVVRSSTGAIIDVENGVVVLMTHFV